MHLKLTLQRAGDVGSGDDVLVDADPTATVADVARTFAERDPRGSSLRGLADVTIQVEGPGPTRGLDPDQSLADAALRSGDRITLQPASGRFAEAADERSAAATLVVREGPDAGARFGLHRGASQVGRGADNEVRLSDPMVSKRHARLNVSDVVEVLDLGSVNGVEIDGVPTARALLRTGDVVRLGDTVLVVESHRPKAIDEVGNNLAFNRSPYLDPVYEGTKVEAPEVPEPARRVAFPLLALLAPLLFGVVMFALTRQLISVVFMALSPVIMVGSYVSSIVSGRREHREALRQFAMQLEHLVARLDRDRAEEAAVRRREHPSVVEVLQGAEGRANLLWARRADRHGFLELRLGLASLPTRSEVEMPSSRAALPDQYDRLQSIVTARELVPAVPVVARLPTIAALGVAGTRAAVLDAARGVLVQVAGLHSPAEVAIAALIPASAATDWDWLKWLPHTSAEHNPLDVDLLAAGAARANALVSALTELIGARSAALGSSGGAREVPSVVVVVEDDAPVDRPRLVTLAEHGAPVGVHVIWVAPTVARLPAACETFFTHDPASRVVAAGFIEGGRTVVPVEGEPVTGQEALAFARDLAPVVDAGAASDDASDVPSRVSFVAESGLDLATSASAVIDRWRQSDSLPPEPGLAATRRRRSQPLQAFVGSSAVGPLTLDLRLHGPHALVGGTTGAGKSEFLQSWVMGLATTHSPTRVTFLFVDYKGGAAFSECVRLPHTVGLVTDLTPHLVHRALRSLNAELRHREHILNAKKAKDVLELEQRGDPECPPSLVIVVDEFAALVSEVPEFVDGVVNVAQRGRSLGLHLILATQRPAGVIRDNLRANTNLRVALRMADESDSDDVVGSKVAGTFDAGLPGRGVVKTGPDRLTLFQSAYIGGWTTAEPPAPEVGIRSLALAGTVEWMAEESELSLAQAQDVDDQGPNDLRLVVDTTCAAAVEVGIGAPRKPWLPELDAVYDLAETPRSKTDEELVFAVADDPDSQRQHPLSFRPDVDGNMSVIGTGGSGKSTFLRTLAVAAGLSTRGGPCHVYGLDFATRGLAMLEPLPHVGSIIPGDDDERVTRLLRMLREMIDERSLRYGAVRAGSIAEYRQLAGAPEEPRILVLLDGFGAFRQAYDAGQRMRIYDQFLSIAADGRQVGIHVVVAADRASSIPTALASVIQRRLVLRLAGDADYLSSGAPADGFDATSPPGRGFMDMQELQVTVLGGTANTARQAAAVSQLAEDMVRSVARPPAPPIERLPDIVRLGDLPVEIDGRPVVGLGDLTLGPFGPVLDTPYLVVGPPRSGKTTALLTLAHAVRRARPDEHVVYVGEGRSALAQQGPWDRRLTDDEGTLDAQVQALAAEVRARAWPAGGLAVFIDGADGLALTLADAALGDLVTVCSRNGHIVAGDAETEQARSSWSVLKALRVARHGLALIPDQFDGDAVFKTPFPPINRRDYPLGRGIYVREGRISKVQGALPELEELR